MAPLKEKKHDDYTDALEYHQRKPAGKLAITATKPMETQRDLALAYSPGVAGPCLEIAKDPNKAYDYTAKGNTVAVISNGTAVLGLGNLGALASKPVMEGKAVLFKRFADIDAFDIEVDTIDPEEFINCVRFLGKSWGGINLEDIRSPECFVIEKRLKEIMDIPVFHDDQHGTAIITLAALMNAAKITKRSLTDCKIVANGAGAAATACIELLQAVGVPRENIISCDRSGVLYKGRQEGMNQWKEKHAIETPLRTLEQALVGADVFIGLSVKDALTADMLKAMAPAPIIFAMANPDPEIRPEVAKKIRPDAIIATGRSDYPNQVNNVMGFPYIFRGALDVRATDINNEMKIAAARALAALAEEPVPEEVLLAYAERDMQFGPTYIIPAPFDPRLIARIPVAVAKAAMETGVARITLDLDLYAQQLSSRLNPIANIMHLVFERLRQHPKRVIFSEGEEEQSIRAALLWRDNGFGVPILIGKETHIIRSMDKMGIEDRSGIEIQNAVVSIDKIDGYIEFLYKRLQRKGFLYRDCARLVKSDRNSFAACLLAMGEADGIVSGLTRGYTRNVIQISRVIDPMPGQRIFGLSIMVIDGKPIFVADTAVHEDPTPEERADIAIQTAAFARTMGYVPRVALLSFSNFGNPPEFKRTQTMRDTLKVLDARKVDFEYDGEMSVDVALEPELRRLHYPFCRLTDSANILIMPGLNSADISTKLMHQTGAGVLIGPLLMGTEFPYQIAQMGASVTDILHLAAFATAFSGERGAAKK